MIRPAWLFSAAAAVVACPSPAPAKQFENSYLRFTLPDGWACELEETEWVCTPPAEQDQKHRMIVILTAKFVGGGDSPQTYIREIERIKARPGVKVIRPPTERLLGEAIWLDATLADSEVRYYQTRYLARAEGRVGVLVTFSAHHSVLAQANAVSNAIARSVVINSAAVRPELQAR